MVKSEEEQLPDPGSASAKTLKGIYAYYQGRNARFEALAAKVAERIVRTSGSDYLFGGLTRASGDEGIDFVGRLDIGSGFDWAYLDPHASSSWARLSAKFRIALRTGAM
jgi:hypothetical protein